MFTELQRRMHRRKGPHGGLAPPQKTRQFIVDTPTGFKGSSALHYTLPNAFMYYKTTTTTTTSIITIYLYVQIQAWAGFITKKMSLFIRKK